MYLYLLPGAHFCKCEATTAVPFVDDRQRHAGSNMTKTDNVRASCSECDHKIER